MSTRNRCWEDSSTSGASRPLGPEDKLLTLALSRISDSLTARQQRQLSYVAEFTADIIHVPGCLNIIADLMSRPPHVVPASGPATAASVKVPSGSLAASQTAGGTTGASSLCQ